MFIFFLVTFLPLIEILGFILIGDKIGASSALLWVIADAIAGFTLLRMFGLQTLHKLSTAAETNAPFEQLFDGLCVIAGALLLIFPGFISDFMALLLFIPPLRHGIFLFLRHRHNGVLDGLGKSSQGFTHWYYTGRKSSGAPMKTIEGEFRKIDQDDKLP